MNRQRRNLKLKKQDGGQNLQRKFSSAVLFFFIALVSFFLLPACTTVPQPEKGDEAGTDLSKLFRFELSNGIPVIIQRAPADRLCSVNLVIEGGTALVPDYLSGIETVTLRALLLGSEQYSAESIQQKENDDYAVLSYIPAHDYSVYTLSCSLPELEDIFAVYADCFIHPLFDKNDFDGLMTLIAQEFQKTQKTPDGVLLTAAQESVYKNHPYSSAPSVTAVSLNRITLNQVKKHHARMLNAARLKFVIAGDFDKKTAAGFVSKMDETFGKLPRSDFEIPEIPEIVLNASPVYVTSETAGEKGYILGCFAAPAAGDPAYVPYAISMQILDTILFKKIVGQDKTADSAGTGIIPGKKMLGVISIYKASRCDQREMSSVLSLFPSEKQIETDLGMYKKMYLDILFSRTATVHGKTEQLIRFLEYTGNADNSFLRQDQVFQVTAAQIAAAYKKYVLDGTIRWIIVSGADSAGSFTFAGDDK
jgi:predicted Zn-dependent peptidase